MLVDWDEIKMELDAFTNSHVPDITIKVNKRAPLSIVKDIVIEKKNKNF